MNWRLTIGGWRLGAVVAVLFVMCTSCAMPLRSFEPVQDPDTLNDVAFTHYLATVPVVSVAEAARAVLMIVGSSEQWPTFEQQWDELSRRQAIKPAWRLQPGQVLDKGTLAYMVRTLCDLPRSFNETLASSTGVGERRYALRTCIDQGLLPAGRPHDPVTGGEILSTVTRAEICPPGRSEEGTNTR